MTCFSSILNSDHTLSLREFRVVFVSTILAHRSERVMDHLLPSVTFLSNFFIVLQGTFIQDHAFSPLILDVQV